MASDRGSKLHMQSSPTSSLVEQWAIKSASWADNWMSESFLRDTDVVTRALQKSLSSPSPLINTPASTPADHSTQQPSSSTSCASSEPDSPAALSTRLPARSSPPLPPPGRGSKRKSRATKRSPTTYINTDPANFRQMVQQVTGIRMAPSAAAAAVLKPEPHRPGTSGAGWSLVVPQQMQQGGSLCMLPTLDTSAFLLGHHQQQAMAPISFVSGEGGFSDLDGFPSFPTLESSWRVM